MGAATPAGTIKECTILAAGEYYGSTPPSAAPGALVIAADGGLDHARRLGIHADLVIGDFDSVSSDADPGDGAIRLPAQKDDPDLLCALKVGWHRGARRFHVYGALGGRIDHTIASIRLMGFLAEQGGTGFLYGDGYVVTAVHDGSLRFAAHPAAPRSMVSVFSLSDRSEGVTISGLKYVLHDAELANTAVQGVSNEFLDHAEASIDVARGTLVVTFPAGSPLPSVTHHHEFTGSLGELDMSVSAALARPAAGGTALRTPL
ncbi:thiamine diphosphokinase [Bifidobacterium leontopitheci]|nr:thiamine diphosphokinase [Bifidobacterium leontopitheci]